MDERNRNTSTGRTLEVTSEVCGRDDIDVPGASTSDVITTPIVPDVEPIDTSSPRVILPSGSPSQPTATATCRPRTWMQQITEGKINEPMRESASLNESNPSTREVLSEEIPDELGCEWRFYILLELPGVRFPTDSTPLNQRRLAENDVLVELIQTTEYLEETLLWGQRDY